MNDEGTAPSLAAGAVPFLMWGEGKRPRRFPPHPIREEERKLAERRGALRFMKAAALEPEDVVLPDEEIRFCGQ